MNPPGRDLPSNMAEQAHRRAPVAQAPDTPTDNNHAYEELRELIVEPEQEGIAAIQDRLDNLEKRTEDVSSVVAEAIQMRREKGDDARSRRRARSHHSGNSARIRPPRPARSRRRALPRDGSGHSQIHHRNAALDARILQRSA